MDFLIFLIVLIVALLAGFLGPITGTGGGSIFIPIMDMIGVLELEYVIPLSTASASALSIRSNLKYFHAQITNIRLGLISVGLVISGAFFGALVMIWAPKNVLRIVLGVLLLYSGYRLVTKKHRSTPRSSTGGNTLFTTKYYDSVDKTCVEYSPKNIKRGLPLLFVGGFMSGLLGIGGGVIYTPVFLIIMGLPPRVAITLSMFLISFSATTGTLVYTTSGLLDPFLAVTAILGALVGSSLGSKIALRIKNEDLKKLLVVYFIIVGIRMILVGLMPYLA